MCEMLLCVHNRGTSGNLLVDSHAPQAGDVVTILSDGANWGYAPLGHAQEGDPNGNYPFFRILQIPNVSADQASNLLAPEIDADAQNPSLYLQYRGFFIDQSKITDSALLAYLADDTRAASTIALTYDATWLASVTTQRTPITGP
jgi:hypothetical protein